MGKRIILVLPVFFALLILAGYLYGSNKSNNDCGYDASFVRLGGHEFPDKTCVCLGLVMSPPSSVPIPVDGLSHHWCYGIKLN
jgi:hypothetical protein